MKHNSLDTCASSLEYEKGKLPNLSYKLTKVSSDWRAGRETKSSMAQMSPNNPKRVSPSHVQRLRLGVDSVAKRQFLFGLSIPDLSGIFKQAFVKEGGDVGIPNLFGRQPGPERRL